MARYSSHSIFWNIVACRCQSWLYTRTSSIFGTSVECRYQSWREIRPSSMFGTSAKYRCQSWVDLCPSSIFGTSAECRCQIWLDIRPSWIIVPARYSGLVPNVDVSNGSIFVPLDIWEYCRMSMSELALYSYQLDIRD
ncbi:hypothetical protein DPMN_138011 [Dreissena polymorpha]|uniref:Uncharacterized protein n=1 Tax=Dreissena polymorpha TaxID=45954 RepID=A0A9D4G6B9_DREPO|nr:hypothetical protein DPMN_138011 [Dreissena polymorpha]